MVDRACVADLADAADRALDAVSDPASGSDSAGWVRGAGQRMGAARRNASSSRANPHGGQDRGSRNVHCATVSIWFMICSMKKDPESDLDIQAYCRGLALQQVQMLTRLAEIAMQLAEAEGARAVAAQARAATPKAAEAVVQAARAEAQEAGRAFSRFSNSVQRSLAQRSPRRRRPLRPRQGRLAAPAAPASATMSPTPSTPWPGIRSLPARGARPRPRITPRSARADRRSSIQDEDNRIEDRPVGSVIAGLACGVGLSDEWRRRASDWSDPPYPPPLTGTPDEIRKRRRARVAELMTQPLRRHRIADQSPASRRRGSRPGCRSPMSRR